MSGMSEFPRYDEILDWQEGAAPEMILDAWWCRVVDAIPSKHFDNLAPAAFGFRKHLAETACDIAAKGGRVRYLEVGVRRGHSLAFVVLAAAQALEYADGIDLWIAGYGGEEQSSPRLILGVLLGLEVDTNRITLYSSDSHDVLPLMAGNGEVTYNLILVDGDHTAEGAAQDLADCWELLEPGGVLVFDDVKDGPEGNLYKVWMEFVGALSDPSSSWSVKHGDMVPYAWIKKS